jgi:hypothetical protein
MKYLAVTLIVLGTLVGIFVFVAVGGIHGSADLMLRDRYGAFVPQESATYKNLYFWAQLGFKRGFAAENFAGYLCAGFLVTLGAILLAWSCDRKKLRSLQQGEATRTV